MQTNLVIVPNDIADAFEAFCQANPQPCPLLERTNVGSAEPRQLAPGADLSTDLPRYRIYRNGIADVVEPSRISDLWRDDLVAFLIGCSFTFERAMQAAGLPLRHIEQGVIVPMYRTNIACHEAAPFAGPMVVSMRPIPANRVDEARAITARYPLVHGAPIHAGNPNEIGIADLGRPDWGDPVEVRAGEVPVFWACGVTPQAVAQSARTTFMITHAPGHMFVTDRRDADLEARTALAG